jgi:CheY-like chemotaxis protein
MKEKVKIFIIDDDEIFQFITRKSFEKLERKDDLLFFHNGEDALNHIKGSGANEQSMPDVIFLDINMPIMDGWDFLDELEKLNISSSRTPYIYMVSSSIDDKDATKSKLYPMIKDYISKPITDVNITEILSSFN